MERFYYEAHEDANIWWIFDRQEGDEPLGCMYSLRLAQTVVGLLNSVSAWGL